MNKKKGKGHDYSYIQWSRKFIIDRLRVRNIQEIAEWP